MINEQGIILTVNKNCRKMFGYSENDMLGRNVSMLMPTPYRQQHNTYLHNYKRSGEAQIIGKGATDVKGEHKSGHTFPVQLTVSKVDTPSGVTYAGVIHKMEDKDKDNAGTVTMDLFGKMVSCNRMLTRMFGYSASEIVGHNIKLLMPKDVAKHHDRYLARFRNESGVGITGLEGRKLSGVHKNGVPFSIGIMVIEHNISGTKLLTGKWDHHSCCFLTRVLV